MDYFLNLPLFRSRPLCLKQVGMNAVVRIMELLAHGMVRKLIQTIVSMPDGNNWPRSKCASTRKCPYSPMTVGFLIQNCAKLLKVILIIQFIQINYSFICRFTWSFHCGHNCDHNGEGDHHDGDGKSGRSRGNNDKSWRHWNNGRNCPESIGFGFGEQRYIGGGRYRFQWYGKWWRKILFCEKISRKIVTVQKFISDS